jgi:uncharacterized protein
MDEILATVRRIIGEDERQPGAPLKGGRGGEAASDAAGDSGDILELTEAINEDGSTRHLVPVGASARREPAFRKPPPVASWPESEAEPRRRAAPDPQSAPARAAPADERLVADVAPSAAAAFGRLAALPRTEHELAVGDRTIEDVVRDLLRPLLQTWLDENLPEIVERLARAEIARAVDKSGVA